MTVARNVIELIGKTPMVRLNRLAGSDLAEVLVKLESFNPGGSVKDRIAMSRILIAEKEGKLTAGATILEPRLCLGNKFN